MKISSKEKRRLQFGRIYWYEGDKYVYIGLCKVVTKHDETYKYVAVPEPWSRGVDVGVTNREILMKDIKEDLLLGTWTNEPDKILAGKCLTVFDTKFEFAKK